MGKHTNRKALAKLAALYARLPTVACKGLCSIACGPVPMTTLEAVQCKKADSQHRLPMVHEDLSCVYLDASKRCGVYNARPLICRVWGVVKSLSCMHGCVPDRWLTAHEFTEIAQAIERVGGEVIIATQDGPVSRGETFLDLNLNARSPEEVEVYAEKTRSLRALHGGRILGVAPSDEERWIDIDDATFK